MSLFDLAQSFISVTEKAAIACSPLIGSGDKMGADKLATEAMREAFNGMPISGTVVIGEGERDKAPMLFIGEELGKGGIEVDIAVDPLEGTNLCAADEPNAITVLGVGPKGTLLHAPDTYMEKIVVGPDCGRVSLENSVLENLDIIASSYDIAVSDVHVIVLDRERHEELIKEIQDAGAHVRLISDGDIFGGILALTPQETGIHALMGVGAAPEGTMMAIAVKALGGQMEARLKPYDEAGKYILPEIVERLHEMGIGDLEKFYSQDDLAKGDDLLFVATGVTSGDLLQGVKHIDGSIQTQTLLISTHKKTLEKITNQHSA